MVISGHPKTKNDLKKGAVQAIHQPHSFGADFPIGLGRMDVSVRIALIAAGIQRLTPKFLAGDHESGNDHHNHNLPSFKEVVSWHPLNLLIL